MSDFYNKYPYTDFHELNLDWVIERVKKLTEDWAATLEEWNNTEEQWQELYNYVHDYFDNLNVQQEINNKIDAMILDGTFQQIATPIIQAKVASDLPGVVSDQIGGVVATQIGPTVASQIDATVAGQIDAAVVAPVNNWLTTHITQPTSPAIDTSLTIPGAAADAAATGAAVNDLSQDIYELETNDIGIVLNQAWSNATVPAAVGYPGYNRCRDFIVYNSESVFETDMTMGGGTSFHYCDANKNLLGTVSSYADIPNTAKYFVFYSMNNLTYAKYTRYVSKKTLETAFVGYDNLENDIASNFIELTDSFYYGSKTDVLSYGIASETFNDNDFEFITNATAPYKVIGLTLQANHIYALVYDVTCNTNYTMRFKIYDGSWKQYIWGGNQTGGASMSGSMIFTSEYTGQFGFDMNVASATSDITGSIKLYDITNVNAAVASSLDYTSFGPDVCTLNIERIGNSNADTHLYGKKVVFYGDSITAQNKYPVIVSNYYGCTAVNAGVGGSTITYRSVTDMSSDSRLEALPSDADIVIIMGGTNDWDKVEIGSSPLVYNSGFDRTTFKGALAYIIQKIENQCPNAKIIVATLIGGRNETRSGADPQIQYLPEADTYGQTDLDFRNAEIEVAETLNIEVCDTWSCGINGMNAFTMIADTVHPTDAGAKLIADYIIGYLKTVQFSS